MKLYTPAEANELLPYLAPTLVELREKHERAALVQRKVETSAAGNGGSKHREEWTRLLERVDELLERLREWSIELRDIDSGLIDFPALVGGEEAFLCWRLGEPEVAWWHPRGTGFANRRPL